LSEHGGLQLQQSVKNPKDSQSVHDEPLRGVHNLLFELRIGEHFGGLTDFPVYSQQFRITRKP
jgi:hypothetical protein